jgi:ABC-2 type transport system permease protein
VNKIKAVFLREYLERVRRKSFVIGLILVPIFMAAVTLLPAYLATREVETGETVLIIDESGKYKTDLEESIQSELSSGEKRFRFIDADPPEGIHISALSDRDILDDLMKDGDLDWYLLLPAGLSDSLNAEFHGRIVSNISLMQMLESRISGVLRRAKMSDLNLAPELYEELSVWVNLDSYRHAKGDADQAGFEVVFFSTFLFVMVLYVTILSFGVMIQRSIIEDKTQKVTEVVLSSMDAGQFFMGKILGIGAVGLTQYFAWGLMTAAVAFSGVISADKMEYLSVINPATFAFFILFYVLGFFLFAGLFASVGAMVTNDQEAQQFTPFILIPILMPIIAMTFILQNPDSGFSVAMSIFPLTAPLVMFMRVNLSMPPFWQLGLSIGLLLLSIWLISVMAGRIFRVGILMTGKKASLAEAWRWVKEA